MVEFTHESVAAIESVEEANALISKATTAWKSRENVHGKATVKAAYATYAALKVGILVRGRSAARQDWTVKAADFGAKFDNLRGGGVSQTMVNQWMALGYAMAVVGVDEEADPKSVEGIFWQHLAFKGGVQRKEVQAVIYSDGATVQDVMDEVRKYIAPDGSRVQQKKAESGEGSGEGEGEGEGGNAQPTRSNLARCQAAIEFLALTLPELGTDEFAQIPADRINEMRKHLNAAIKAVKDAAAAEPESLTA